MQINIGKIEDYKPIKFINGKYVISWGLVNYGENAAEWYYFIKDYKPSISDIKSEIESYINECTKNNIINNFKWNNMVISLTVEDQLNYKLLFDVTMLRNGDNLPETVKFKYKNKNVFYTFESLDEMKEFIICMNNHIRNCILQGNELKESIDYSIYNI